MDFLEPDILLTILGLAAIGFVVWLACQPRCAFVVRIVDGKPQTVRGAATCAFLGQIRDLCAEHGIRHGTVRGLVRGKRIALAFSRDIPPNAQQQLRNWWGLSGWPAPAARS